MKKPSTRTRPAPPAKKNGKVSRSGINRSTILLKAIDIVRSEGADALTMARLRRDLSLSPSGLRLFFSDRDQILRALIEGLVAREEQHIEGSVGEDPRTILRFLVEDTFRGYFEEDANMDLAAALLGEVVANPGLLEPLENLSHAIEPQLTGLKDSALAYIIHLALDGLRFDRMIGWGFLPPGQHEAVRLRLLQLIDTL